MGLLRMKYHNKKIDIDGHMFDSRKEATRYLVLKGEEKAGLIQNLQLQTKYELIPAIYEGTGKNRKCLQRACVYKADFTYEKNGRTVVEDTKGYRTKEYLIKKKLLFWRYGIQIDET